MRKDDILKKVESTLLAQTILFVLMWFGTWAFFFMYMVPRGINYLNYYAVTVLYFLSIALTISVFFKKEFAPFVANTPPLAPLLALALFSVMNVLLYRFIPKFFRKPTSFITHNPVSYFLRLDPRYLISKTSDIVYQQLFIILVVGALDRLGFRLSEITALFAFFFGIIHLPLIAFDGLFWGMYFIFAALCSAVVFPPLILHVPYGFVYSFMIHGAFYIFSGVLFWVVLKKK